MPSLGISVAPGLMEASLSLQSTIIIFWSTNQNVVTPITIDVTGTADT